MWNSRENKLLRRALALYAGDHVLSRVLEKGEAFLSPQGAYAELTMLFYDIAWLKEVPGIHPKSMTEWATALAELATSTIKKGGGTFDTFVGDARSAWWEPTSVGHHAQQAVACAQQLVAAVERLNERATSARYPIIGLQIGIHTGTVALGNWGSSLRLRYCPMGDAVNVAFRLCGVARNHSVPIAFSEATHSHLTNEVAAKYLDRITVKGQSEPMAIYGLDA